MSSGELLRVMALGPLLGACSLLISANPDDYGTTCHFQGENANPCGTCIASMCQTAVNQACARSVNYNSVLDALDQCASKPGNYKPCSDLFSDASDRLGLCLQYCYATCWYGTAFEAPSTPNTNCVALAQGKAAGAQASTLNDCGQCIQDNCVEAVNACCVPSGDEAACADWYDAARNAQQCAQTACDPKSTSSSSSYCATASSLKDLSSAGEAIKSCIVNKCVTAGHCPCKKLQ